MRGPAGRVRIDAQHGGVRLKPGIEPVADAAGHADQVAGGAIRIIDAAILVQDEMAAALHEETDLVLRMDMLVEKFLPHGGVGLVARAQPQHVGRAGAGGAHQRVQMRAIGVQDRLGGRVRVDGHWRFPALEANADGGEGVGDHTRFFAAQFWLTGGGIRGHCQAAHRHFSKFQRTSWRRASSHSNRNSSASSRASARSISGAQT